MNYKDKDNVRYSDTLVKDSARHSHFFWGKVMFK